MGVATKGVALNAFSPSKVLLADNISLVRVKSGISQGILLLIFCGNHA